MRARRAGIGVFGEDDLLDEPGHVAHADRIVGPHPGAMGLQGGDLRQCGGIPHVVGVGLEGEPEQCDYRRGILARHGLSGGEVRSPSLIREPGGRAYSADWIEEVAQGGACSGEPPEESQRAHCGPPLLQTVASHEPTFSPAP